MAQAVFDILVPVSKTVVMLGGASAAVRITITTVLQKFGAHDPMWDRYWPRVPWRPVWRGWTKFREWREENFQSGQATAGKAGGLTQLALPYQEGHSLIGRVRLPFNLPYYALVGEDSQRHKLYIASPASGKSLMLQTALATMPDRASAFVIDPKGDHTHDVLLPLAERGHKLAVLDPLRILPFPSHSINLLAQIRLINQRVGQDMTTMLCNRLADVAFPSGQERDPFFTNAARELWSRAMCFVLVTMRRGTMMDVRRLLTVGFIEAAPEDPDLAIRMVWEAMLACPVYDGYVSSMGAEMLSHDERTRANILATVRTKTGFWDHHQVQAISRLNNVDLCNLKNPDSNQIISLVAPVGEMRTTLKPWFGQITSLALAIMELIPGDLKVKTQFVLEEVQALGGGTLQGVGESFPLLRGYGAAVTAVAQDIPGLRKAFPQDWQSMIGSSQHVVFMASNDPETIQFVSENAFGNRTVKKKKWGLPFLKTVAVYQQPVITPDQTRRLLEARRGNAIVMRNGKRSMIVKTALSYNTLPVWMLNPNRDHGETPARKWTRRMMARFQPEPAAQPIQQSRRARQ